MMRRLQTILLVAWVLVALLLWVFNWSRAWAPEPVAFLFMEFQWPWIAWLLIGSMGALALMRLLTWMELRFADRRLQRELERLKAAAFDERHAEMEQLANTIQERVEASLRQHAGGAAPDDSSSGD